MEEDMEQQILKHKTRLERYVSRDDADDKIVYLLRKLSKLPVTLDLLSDTGVGRIVNAYRKKDGEIGDLAKSLVMEWKRLLPPDSPPPSIKTETVSETSYESTHDDPRRTPYMDAAIKSESRSESESESRSEKGKVKSEPADEVNVKNERGTEKHKEPEKTVISESSSKERSIKKEKYDGDYDKYESQNSDDEDKAANGPDAEDEDDLEAMIMRQEQEELKKERQKSKESSQRHEKEHRNKDDRKHREEKRSDSKHRSREKHEDRPKKDDRHKEKKHSRDDEHSSRKHREQSSSQERHTTKRETAIKSETETAIKSETETAIKSKTETAIKSKTETAIKSETETAIKTETETSATKNKERDDKHKAHEKHKSDSKHKRSSSQESRHKSDSNKHSSDSKHNSDSTKHSKSDSSKQGKHSRDKSKHRSDSLKQGSEDKHSNNESSKINESKSEKHRTDESKSEKHRTDEIKSEKHRSDESKKKEKDVKVEKTKEEKVDGNKGVKRKVIEETDDDNNGMSFDDMLNFKPKTGKKKKLNNAKPGGSTVESSKPSSAADKGKSSNEKIHKSKSHHERSHSSSKKVKSHSSSSSSHRDRDVESLVKKEFKVPEPKEAVSLSADDIVSSLPEINPNYKPLPYRPLDLLDKKKNNPVVDEVAITSKKNFKFQMYSGRKTTFLKAVPSLFDSCIQVLKDNIDALDFVGGVPYDILKPVLEVCSATQLYNLEDVNPQFIGETEELWEDHSKRDFRKASPEEFESWRELYLRCHDERDRKLKNLTANIAASMSASKPVRQTKLAYVDSSAKPPRHVRRQQMKHGTATRIKEEDPLSKLSSHGGKKTVRPAPPRTADLVPLGRHKKEEKTVAPMMKKTIRFIKRMQRR